MRNRLFLLWTVLSLCACSGDTGGTGGTGGNDGNDGTGGNGPTDPPTQLATLSGTVKEDSTGVAIAGATVTVGGRSTTSGQDGTFEVSGVATGDSVSITVSAARYESFTGVRAIKAGANPHISIYLQPQQFWAAGDFYFAYVPRGVSVYRGVLLVLGGGDTRPFIWGDMRKSAGEAAYAMWGQRFLDYLTELQSRAFAFGRQRGLAVVGADVAAVNGETLPLALAALAEATGHAELAQAPVLSFGISLGGSISEQLAMALPARFIGFLSLKGGKHVVDAGAAREVPAYLFIGGADEDWRISNLNETFEYNRSRGAPWAVAIEPGTDHFPTSDFDLLFHWLEDIFDRRVPGDVTPGAPVALRAVDQTTGWLGDLKFHDIYPYAEFAGDKLKAAWLPTERTAREWKVLVTRPGKVPGEPGDTTRPSRTALPSRALPSPGGSP